MLIVLFLLLVIVYPSDIAQRRRRQLPSGLARVNGASDKISYTQTDTYLCSYLFCTAYMVRTDVSDTGSNHMLPYVALQARRGSTGEGTICDICGLTGRSHATERRVRPIYVIPG